MGIRARVMAVFLVRNETGTGRVAKWHIRKCVF
jgi:hypothetical protein